MSGQGEEKAAGGAAKADKVETIAVRRDEDGMRVDRWFRTHFPSVGYTYLQKLLRS